MSDNKEIEVQIEQPSGSSDLNSLTCDDSTPNTKTVTLCLPMPHHLSAELEKLYTPQPSNIKHLEDISTSDSIFPNNLSRPMLKDYPNVSLLQAVNDKILQKETLQLGIDRVHQSEAMEVTQNSERLNKGLCVVNLDDDTHSSVGIQPLQPVSRLPNQAHAAPQIAFRKITVPLRSFNLSNVHIHPKETFVSTVNVKNTASAHSSSVLETSFKSHSNPVNTPSSQVLLSSNTNKTISAFQNISSSAIAIPSSGLSNIHVKKVVLPSKPIQSHSNPHNTQSLRVLLSSKLDKGYSTFQNISSSAITIPSSSPCKLYLKKLVLPSRQIQAHSNPRSQVLLKSESDQKCSTFQNISSPAITIPSSSLSKLHLKKVVLPSKQIQAHSNPRYQVLLKSKSDQKCSTFQNISSHAITISSSDLSKLHLKKVVLPNKQIQAHSNPRSQVLLTSKSDQKCSTFQNISSPAITIPSSSLSNLHLKKVVLPSKQIQAPKKILLRSNTSLPRVINLQNKNGKNMQKLILGKNFRLLQRNIGNESKISKDDVEYLYTEQKKSDETGIESEKLKICQTSEHDYCESSKTDINVNDNKPKNISNQGHNYPIHKKNNAVQAELTTVIKTSEEGNKVMVIKPVIDNLSDDDDDDINSVCDSQNRTCNNIYPDQQQKSTPNHEISNQIEHGLVDKKNNPQKLEFSTKMKLSKDGTKTLLIKRLGNILRDLDKDSQNSDQLQKSAPNQIIYPNKSKQSQINMMQKKDNQQKAQFSRNFGSISKAQKKKKIIPKAIIVHKVSNLSNGNLESDSQNGSCNGNYSDSQNHTYDDIHSDQLHTSAPNKIVNLIFNESKESQINMMLKKDNLQTVQISRKIKMSEEENNNSLITKHTGKNLSNGNLERDSQNGTHGGIYYDQQQKSVPDQTIDQDKTNQPEPSCFGKVKPSDIIEGMEIDTSCNWTIESVYSLSSNADPVDNQRRGSETDSSDEAREYGSFSKSFSVKEDTWRKHCKQSYVVLERLPLQCMKQQLDLNTIQVSKCSTYCRMRAVKILCGLQLLYCEHRKPRIIETGIPRKLEMSDKFNPRNSKDSNVSALKDKFPSKSNPYPYSSLCKYTLECNGNTLKEGDLSMQEKKRQLQAQVLKRRRFMHQIKSQRKSYGLKREPFIRLLQQRRQLAMDSVKEKVKVKRKIGPKSKQNKSKGYTISLPTSPSTVQTSLVNPQASAIPPSLPIQDVVFFTQLDKPNNNSYQSKYKRALDSLITNAHKFGHIETNYYMVVVDGEQIWIKINPDMLKQLVLSCKKKSSIQSDNREKTIIIPFDAKKSKTADSLVSANQLSKVPIVSKVHRSIGSTAGVSSSVIPEIINNSTNISPPNSSTNAQSVVISSTNQLKRNASQPMDENFLKTIKRHKLEAKYPLPPGVVIKSEPISDGYDLDNNWSVATEVDTGFSHVDNSQDNAFLSSFENDSTACHKKESDNPSIYIDDLEMPPLLDNVSDWTFDSNQHNDSADDASFSDGPPVLDLQPSIPSSDNEALNKCSTSNSRTISSTTSSIATSMPTLNHLLKSPISSFENSLHEKGEQIIVKRKQVNYESGYDSSLSASSSSDILIPSVSSINKPSSTDGAGDASKPKSRIEQLKELLKRREAQVENMRKLRSLMPLIDLDSV